MVHKIRGLDNCLKNCPITLFLSPEIAPYIYIYTLSIMPYMEYCCHVWVGDPSCYLELFRQQKQKCSTVVSSFASSFELLAYRGNGASLRVFSCCYCYYMISVTISRCYKDVSFFAQLDSGILCL